MVSVEFTTPCKCFFLQTEEHLMRCDVVHSALSYVLVTRIQTITVEENEKISIADYTNDLI
jgi:hypothetical protein